MSASRTFRLVWFVTWFNVRMLLASEFFILTTFITPLIFASLAFLLFESGGRAGRPDVDVRRAGHRDDGRLEHDALRLRRRHCLAALGGDPGAAGQRAEPVRLHPGRPDMGAVVLGFYGIVATLAWGVLLFGMPLEATFPWMLPLSLLAAVLSLGCAGDADRHHLRAVPARQRAGEPARVPDLADRRSPRPGCHAAVLGASTQLAAGTDLGHGGHPRRRHRVPSHRSWPSPCACVLAVVYYLLARVMLVVVLDKARRDATLALQ